jgi:hypothetical protein
MINEIEHLKCKCCKCYDSFDGCQALDCDVDFGISIPRVKEVAKEYGLSVDTIAAVLEYDEAMRLSRHAVEHQLDEIDDIDNGLPENFPPLYDSKFLISFADSPYLGKKTLVEMHPEDLKRLRAEIDAALQLQEGLGL